MKKSLLLTFSLLFAVTFANAQTTAMDFNKKDCKGNMHNLYADLDAGNAVVLFFYMPNCGSCPPPAKRIQTMANNIMKTYPGKVKAYALPYENKTTCSYSATWVTSNNLSLYAPLDSGASQVAHYGGFGMPTVVLLGGKDHKVLFSTLSFSTSDTTEMRDEILKLFKTSNGVNELPHSLTTLNIYPNPANRGFTLNLNLKEASNLQVDVADITGKQIAVLMQEKVFGTVSKEVSTANMPNGIYLLRIQADGKTVTRKIPVVH